MKLRTFTFSLKENTWQLLLAHLNCQRYHACALEPLPSEIRVLAHKPCSTGAVHLITELDIRDYRVGDARQRGDFWRGWMEQDGVRFHPATQNSTQFRNCKLFLKFFVYCFQTMKDHKKVKLSIRQDWCIKKCFVEN